MPFSPTITTPLLGCCPSAPPPPRLWQVMEQIVRADYSTPNEKAVGTTDCRDWRKYSFHILGPQTDSTDTLAANPTYSLVEDTFTTYHEKWVDYLGNVGEKIQTWSDELTAAEKLG